MTEELYQHYSLVPWDTDRWPNFRPSEPFLACPCCGEFYLAPATMDRIQAVRTEIGMAINLNSAHRCFLRNALVGGSADSQHKKRLAFDISVRGWNKEQVKRLVEALIKYGFTAFGFYRTFIHTDDRPAKRNGKKYVWVTEGGQVWNSLTYLVR